MTNGEGETPLELFIVHAGDVAPFLECAITGYQIRPFGTQLGSADECVYNSLNELKELTMTDATTQQLLRISTDGTAGPYIMVPVSQLENVKQLLSRSGIRHWVDEHAISLNGTPEIAIVNLGRGGDPSAVQNVLDSAR